MHQAAARPPSIQDAESRGYHSIKWLAVSDWSLSMDTHIYTRACEQIGRNRMDMSY